MGTAEIVVAVLGIVSTLLTLFIKLWWSGEAKKKAEAERRAKEDLEAEARRKESQQTGAADGAAHDAQEAAAEEWRKKHGG